MDASTWTVVTVCAVMGAFTFAVFFLSLVPGLPARARAEVASWPDQWTDMRQALRRHQGIHGASDSAVAASTHHADIEPVHEAPEDPTRPIPGWETAPAAPADPATGKPMNGDDRSQDVMVIRDDSTTQTLPVIPERTDAGATEDWSPRDAVEAVEPNAAGISAAHTPADIEERTLLAEFDAIVASMRAVPKELVAFGHLVDRGLVAAGVNPEMHQRWRATAFDVPTGEYRLALATA